MTGQRDNPGVELAIRRQVVRGDVLTGKVTWAEMARMLAILRKTRETTGRQVDVNSAALDIAE